MAKLSTIDVKNLPEVKQRITDLENALREVKRLVQQGRYYRINSLIDRVLNREW